MLPPHQCQRTKRLPASPQRSQSVSQSPYVRPFPLGHEARFSRPATRHKMSKFFFFFYLLSLFSPGGAHEQVFIRSPPWRPCVIRHEQRERGLSPIDACALRPALSDRVCVCCCCSARCVSDRWTGPMQNGFRVGGGRDVLTPGHLSKVSLVIRPKRGMAYTGKGGGRHGFRVFLER